MRPKLFYIVVLVTAFFLDAIVSYVFTNAVMRVAFGLVILFPIVWAADALGIAHKFSDLPKTRTRHRQYRALRSNVVLLIDVVKRLNWLAVDLERGIRDRDEVTKEMEQAYELLKEILEEIRDTAGRASAGLDVPVEPDLPVDRGQPPQETEVSADEA